MGGDFTNHKYEYRFVVCALYFIGSIEFDKSSTDRLHEPERHGEPSSPAPSVKSEASVGKTPEKGKRQESGKAPGASLSTISAATVAFLSLKNNAKEKFAAKRKGE